MTSTSNFAIYYAGEAYSTAGKVMGRQSAGKSFMKGVARTWPHEPVHGLGPDRRAAEVMFGQLQQDGYDGTLRWRSMPDWDGAAGTGTLYYPAPPSRQIAAARNLVHPASFSLMGVTHTLASHGAMDQLAELVLPPFKPWDALICTSEAARTLVTCLHEEMRSYWRDNMGATRFVDVQLPVIPLGVNVPDFAPQAGARLAARSALALRAEETVFFCPGRLAFHAKANPAPVYQALEKAARVSAVVCIEAGVFPNEDIRRAYLAAQQALAPSVRFIWIDGQDEGGYRQAWQVADVFVSLADNIQETFGLTPVEAMAAGLPVVVSDWNGYKDTVRDGIDGFRIPTVLPPAGMGRQQALRYALQLDSYDRYIGRASLATVVEPDALAQAFICLAGDPALRAKMGAAGHARALADFDWPRVLLRYTELAAQLGTLRERGQADPVQAWPPRADPYLRFAHYATRTLAGHWPLRATADAAARLRALLALTMTSYAFESEQIAGEVLPALLAALDTDARHTVGSVLAAAGLATPAGMRALMWLWKFDLVEVAAAP